MKTHLCCPICRFNPVIAVDSVETRILQTKTWKKKGASLDMRGLSQLISTLYYCPHCHYIWRPDSEDHNVTGFLDIADSDKFRVWIDHKEFPEAVKVFIGYYVIAFEERKYKDAGVAALNAAWGCDDHRLYMFSRICRELAAESFFLYLNEERNNFETVYLHQMIDCYRRAGNIESAVGYIIRWFRNEIDEFYLKRRIALRLADDEKEVNPCFSPDKILMYGYFLCMKRDRRIHYLSEVPENISAKFFNVFLDKLRQSP